MLVLFLLWHGVLWRKVRGSIIVRFAMFAQVYVNVVPDKMSGSCFLLKTGSLNMQKSAFGFCMSKFVFFNHYGACCGIIDLPSLTKYLKSSSHLNVSAVCLSPLGLQPALRGVILCVRV